MPGGGATEIQVPDGRPSGSVAISVRRRCGAHLALAEPLHPHRAERIVRRVARDALAVGLLDHRGHSLLRRPAWLREYRKIAAARQLVDTKFNRADTSLPVAVAAAISLVHRIRRPLPGPPCPAPYSISVSSSISRSAAKPIISRSNVVSELFSKSSRRMI
jgi:hypothetical protein